MSITSRINEMSTHIEQAYDELQGLGADLTNVNKNIENISMVLDDIYDSMPQVSGEGTSLTLDDTRVGKIKSTLKGNTSQITYTGKNLLNLNLSKSVNQNGITYSVARDGTITINGTATANVDIQYLNETLQTLANTKYCLNYIYVSGSLNGTIHVFNQDSSHGWNGWNMDLTASNSGHNVVTLTSFTTDMNMSGAKIIRIDNGAVLNNLKFKLQFTKSESADYDYEPYVGGTASPNPSYPQPVNVVSGDNEINVVGKNLLQLTNDKETFNYQNTHTIEDNTYIGIPTANWAQTRYKFYLEKNTQYTFSSKLTLEGSNFPSKWQVTIKNDDDTNIFSGLVDIIDNKISVSFNSGDNEYNEISFWSRTNDSSRDITKTTYSDIQLEKGSSVSEYEPYQGNTYNIDLPVENLLPISSLASTTSNGITFTNNNDGTYTLNGTATAEANFYIFDGGNSLTANSQITFSCKEADSNIRLFWYDNWDTISGSSARIGGVSPNYTTTNNISAIAKLRMNISIVNGATINNVTIKPMIQKGTKVNSFTPYGTTPIEMCKIGNYQDYFYKDSDKWYLHKEIGKVVLNGSESWTYALQSNVSRFDRTIANVASGSTTNNPILSTHFKPEFALVDKRIFLSGYGNTIAIMDNDFSNTNDFKNWLSSNNVTCYYGYTTPTTTEITYQPLIDQLNLLEKAMSKDGQTNISQVNNDLPFIISASALKEWQESSSLNSTLSMVNPLSLGNTLNTQEIDNNTQPIEVDNIEPLEEEENE